MALILDRILGDPPNRFHPVAWMGTAIGIARRRAPRQGRWGPLAYGALLVLGGEAGVIGAGLVLQQLLLLLPWPLRWFSLHDGSTTPSLSLPRDAC